MNEDHLDPDRHLHGVDDDDCYSEVMEILKEHDSGRWDYDKNHCCITGKDADLAPWGQQGIELLGTSYTRTEYHARLRVHVGKTWAGTDVCLNLPNDISDEDYEQAREEYVDQAQEVVCSIPGSGDWSGDDWYISDQFDITVPITLNPDDDSVEKEATWESIYAAYEEAVAEWDREVSTADAILDCIAGWKRWNPETKEYERVKDVNAK
jgi:hypothetical protein